MTDAETTSALTQLLVGRIEQCVCEQPSRHDEAAARGEDRDASRLETFENEFDFLLESQNYRFLNSTSCSSPPPLPLDRQTTTRAT